MHHNCASLKKRFGQINTRHRKTSLPHPHNINRYLPKVVKFANLVVHQSNQSADSLTCLTSMRTQRNVLWFLLVELFISFIYIIHSTVLFNKRQWDKGQKGKWQLEWNDTWNWAKHELCLQTQLVLFLIYLHLFPCMYFCDWIHFGGFCFVLFFSYKNMYKLQKHTSFSVLNLVWILLPFSICSINIHNYMKVFPTFITITYYTLYSTTCSFLKTYHAHPSRLIHLDCTYY